MLLRRLSCFFELVFLFGLDLEHLGDLELQR
jgi:hypothetical protein